MRLTEPDRERPRPLRFPCLLWEPTLDTTILASATGTGTVLHVGHSQVLTLGMIIPFGASRWVYGDERWDFIVPPPRMKIILQNKPGSQLWSIGLETKIQVLPE